MNDRCRICGTSRTFKEIQYAITPDHKVVLCGTCAIYETDPFPLNTSAFYQESYYSRQKSGRFVPVLEWSIRLFRFKRTLNLVHYYKRGSILDIGCGRGLMLYYMRRFFGWTVEGTQISRTAHAYATETLGLPVHLGDLLSMPMPEKPYTLVTLYHVLEHLTDPVLYLREIHRRLESKGACFIEVPNAGSTTARSLTSHWFGWDVPYHTFHFSPSSLSKLLEQEGFKIEKIRHWSLEFNTFIVMQSWLNAIFDDKDYFFRLLQRKARFAHHPLKAMTCLFLGVLLTPVAFVVALFNSMRKEGEVIRVHARKVR